MIKTITSILIMLVVAYLSFKFLKNILKAIFVLILIGAILWFFGWI